MKKIQLVVSDIFCFNNEVFVKLKNPCKRGQIETWRNEKEQFSKKSSRYKSQL